MDNVVTALLSAIKADRPHGLKVNVGSGKPTSGKELVQTLLKVAGFDMARHVSGKYRLGDIRHNWADLGHAARYLDYRPAVSLGQGLARFFDWVKTQLTFLDRAAEADRELLEKGLSA